MFAAVDSQEHRKEIRQAYNKLIAVTIPSFAKKLDDLRFENRKLCKVVSNIK